MSQSQASGGSAGDVLVLAVDCSTTAAKAVAFGPDGRTVATARRPIALAMPAPGCHEQRAADWWTATSAAIRETVEQTGAGRIANVTITHQRESFSCLDGDREIRPAMLWMDTRAAREVEEVGTDRVHEISGRPPDTTPSLYKLVWLDRHEPSVLRTATRIGDVSAYLIDRLTGRWASSIASADALALLDMRTATWSPELVDLAGVRVGQLPELARPGEQIGTITGDAAQVTGLRVGTPVIAGAGDGQCAAIGSGAVRPGPAYLNLGTAVVSGTLSTEYRWGRAFRTMISPTGTGYLLEAFLTSGTYLVNWFRDRFRGADGDLDAQIAEIPRGSGKLLTLPFWNGVQTPDWNADARGAVIGWNGSHGPAHLYRSLLEGVAFIVRDHLDGMADEIGYALHPVLTTGGGTRSAVWNQMLADVIDAPLKLCRESETTALGAAMLGTVAAGIHPDLTAAAQAMCGTGDEYLPDRQAVADYALLRSIHGELYPALETTYRRLSELNR